MTPKTKISDYWFSHDRNSHQDPKHIKLVRKFGGFGIGIFWTIVELLHNRPGYQISIIDAVDFLDISSYGERNYILEVIHYCIEIDLFTLLDGDEIMSQRVIKNIIMMKQRTTNKKYKNKLEENGEKNG